MVAASEVFVRDNPTLAIASLVTVPSPESCVSRVVPDFGVALSAAKDYYLFAGVNRVEVVQKGGSQVVRVRGTADSNALKSAKIEIGKGEAPASWIAIGPAVRAAGPDAVLGDIPAAKFEGSKVWQIRVIVTHTDGTTREAHFKLSLG